MKFEDARVFREDRFSIGRERASGDYYLSIPVRNRLVEYEEYYRLSAEEFERIHAGGASAAQPLLSRVRARQEDDRLIQKPGRDRGSPV